MMVFGISLLAFSSIMYAVYRRNQAEDFDAMIFNRAQGIARSISISPAGQLEINQALIAESGRLFPFQFGNEYIEVRGPDGKSIAHSNNLGKHSLPFEVPWLSVLSEGQTVYNSVNATGPEEPYWGAGKLRVLSMPLVAQQRLQIIMQLGVSTHAYDKSLAQLRTAIFFIGVPLTLCLAGAAGWWLAGRAFQPIHRIVVAAQRLGAEQLKERLPVPEADDELSHLSRTLNDMLERLEKAFNSQQRFVADASHELKTPLTILQGELAVLRQQPREPAEYQAFLESASEELHRLTMIIQNLLVLARADSGRPLELKHEVRLDEVVLEVVERLQSFGRQNQVKVSIQIDEALHVESEREEVPWITVRGEEDLLASLFFNLVHNAIKHSSAGQTVEISIRRGQQRPIVVVRDHGTGIRPEELPHIFERFFRAANPARRETEGTGLGLALAQWIAEVHGAKIGVESKPAEGSTFTVRF